VIIFGAFGLLGYTAKTHEAASLQKTPLGVRDLK